MRVSKCQYCQEDIRTDLYRDHIKKCKEECILPRSSPEDSDNYIERHVNRSHQLSGKLSLKSFLEDYSYFDESVEDVLDEFTEYVKPTDEESVCPICLNKLSQRHTRQLHACKHMFCDKCLHIWATYKTTCPVCKQTFL